MSDSFIDGQIELRETFRKEAMQHVAFPVINRIKAVPIPLHIFDWEIDDPMLSSRYTGADHVNFDSLGEV